MKYNILKKSAIGLFCLSSLLLGSCIDDVTPMDDYTTEEGVSLKSLVYGLPANFNNGDYNASSHSDFGYGTMMHIRDVMTEEMAPITEYGYWSSYAENTSLGSNYNNTGAHYRYYFKHLENANAVIKIVRNTSAPSALEKQYLGIGLAFRAFLYLDIARMYEFLPTDVTTGVNEKGNSVINLTAPIINESITVEEAQNNPRATREEMGKFILDDLNEAETLLKDFIPADKSLPDLSVIYGLKTRLYMWLEDYPNAKLYARKAIDLGRNTPMTETQQLDVKTGFNTVVSSWMFANIVLKENFPSSGGNLRNWIGWMSSEAAWGYAGQVGEQVRIDRRTYERIDDRDYRKLLWKAPAGSSLDGQNKYANEARKAYVVTYGTLKFRPGDGNVSIYNTGAAVSIPLMRIEEMYFAEMEAAEHVSPGTGKALLESFMKTYRFAEYTCTNSDVIDEIIFQKRIEFWGEGISFFDYKRLNLSVTRGYVGTNQTLGKRINTVGRPAWMNLLLMSFEEDTNVGVRGYNNPDPSGKYTLWLEP